MLEAFGREQFGYDKRRKGAHDRQNGSKQQVASRQRQAGFDFRQGGQRPLVPDQLLAQFGFAVLEPRQLPADRLQLRLQRCPALVVVSPDCFQFPEVGAIIFGKRVGAEGTSHDDPFVAQQAVVGDPVRRFRQDRRGRLGGRFRCRVSDHFHDGAVG